MAIFHVTIYRCIYLVPIAEKIKKEAKKTKY